MFMTYQISLRTPEQFYYNILYSYMFKYLLIFQKYFLIFIFYVHLFKFETVFLMEHKIGKVPDPHATKLSIVKFE